MREKSYIVYLHINKINKKVYVGITHYTCNPNIRWGNGLNYKGSVKFYNAILKYGWENFEHIILCKTSRDKAIILERALIHFYKSKGNSYNIAEGGEGSNSFSEDTRVKLSNKLKGRKRKPESINATVTSRKLKNNYNRNPYWLRRPMGGRNNPMFGKHLSEEVKSKKYKKILQFNKNGEFIKEYESIKAASVALSISSTNIVSALKGRSKTAANYIWRYKYE